MVLRLNLYLKGNDMYNPQLDTFIKVADAGSFLKAAEQLYISSSAVIQQINLLEERCGVKLLERTHRGVRLTPAGESFYQDAKEIIQKCNDAVAKAQAAAGASRKTIRIGTAVLFQCRELLKLRAAAEKILPELIFEIPPMSKPLGKEDDFAGLGREYDLLEGIYCTICWKGLCSFLELYRTPIWCAVAPNHPLAKKKTITLHDLEGESLIIPRAGVSYEMDAFRQEILEKYPTVHLVDSPGYGLDTFTLCELNGYLLTTHPVYTDIHPNLVTIPLESSYDLPYGIIYANYPTPAVRKFLDVVREINGLE